MRGFSSKQIPAVLVVGLAVSLWAVMDVVFAQTAKAEKPVEQKVAPVKVENEAVKNAKPAVPSPKPEVPSTTDIEIQRRFNELKSELLDDRADSIEWWLAVVAIVLTFFGIVVAIAGLIGFRRFQAIEKEARESVGAAKEYEIEAGKHAKETEKLLEDIKQNREKSIEHLNAQIAANEPEQAKQVADDVRENPIATLLDKAVAKALSLQLEGKGEEALETWRSIANVVEVTDKDLAARAWFSIGYLRTEQGKYREAIAAYDEVLRLQPDDAVAYNNRGLAKMDLGQYEAALADFDEALRLKPDQAETYNNRGLAKKDLGQHEAAIADFDEALRLQPDLAETYNNRGNAKRGLGQHEAAIADFDEALRLKPDQAEPYNNRGFVGNIMGRHEAASEDCDKAIRLKPDYPEAYYNRGVAKAALSRKDDARKDFQTALDLARKAGNQELAALAEQELQELDEE